MRYTEHSVRTIDVNSIDKVSMNNTGCPSCNNECETMLGYTFTKKDKLEFVVAILMLIVGCLGIGYAFYSMGELAYETVKELQSNMQNLNH